MSETDQAQTTTEPTAESSEPAAAGSSGGGETSTTPPSDAAAAPAPSKVEMAKAKLAAFGSLGKGALGKLSGVLKTVLVAPLAIPRAILGALIGGELSTKLLVVGFFASVGLLAFTGLQLYQTVMHEREVARAAALEEAAKTKLQKALFEQEKEQINAANVLFLDKFSGILNNDGGTVPNRSFELEVYIECNEPDTCSYVKGNTAPFKEKIAEALQGQTYDDLITDTGKEKLREKISESVGEVLEHWHEGASVRRVYFTHFQMK
jgi:flagellar basal body-associated protein FliL